MTRRRIYWIPDSSGGLVNLGMDIGDDMVSGVSYKTCTVKDGPWSKQERKPEVLGRADAHPCGKYSAAWRTMTPIRPKPKFPASQPLDDAGLFSYLMLSWLTPLMIRGFRSHLDENTIPPLSVHDASAKNAKRLHLLWEEEISRHGAEKASVLRVMLKFQRTRVIFDVFMGWFFSVVSVLGPMLVIPRILEYSEEPSGNVIHGIGLCLVLFFTECLRSVIAFFTSDVYYLFEGVYYGPLVFLSCSSMIACSIASYLVLGPTALIAIFCYILLFPLEALLTRIIVKIQDRTSVVSDSRIRVTSEVLTCIKLIKMYTWEKPFATLIKDLRKRERNLMEKSGFGQSLTTTALLIAPTLAIATMLLIHTFLKLKLTVSTAFTTVAILNPLRMSVFFVPFAVKAITNSKIAMKRLKKFFLQENPVLYVQALNDPSKALVLEGATLSWRKTWPGVVNGALELDRNKHPTEGMASVQPPLGVIRPEDQGDSLGPELRKIDLVVSQGTMLGIFGNTGSGKSSLLSAILGEMHLLEGSVAVHGSLAYVPQQAWIVAGSIRDNILMGGQYDEARYLQVLHCCSLKQDLEILPFGDMTEIGERGINLSGGQKQRVSLARAVYSDRELYLVDDPLSAVDAHVGKHIFEECIKKALRGKTIILVTHQLQYLEFCDQIIFLEDGKICENGTHNELMQKKGQYAQLIQKMHGKAKQNVLQDAEETAKKPRMEDQAQTTFQEEPANENSVLENQLTKKEEVKEASLKWNVYHHYIQAAGGYVVIAIILLLMLLIIFFMTFNFWWLSYWLQQGSGTNSTGKSSRNNADPGDILANPQLPFYQLVYGLSVLLLICVGICSAWIFTKVTRKASTVLHNKLFDKVSHYPMSFFDTTPTGRLLNCFAGDLAVLDHMLPMVTEEFLLFFLSATAILVVVIIVSPFILVIGAIVGTVCITFYRIFKRVISVFKRLQKYSRSPLFSHLLTSLRGLSSIHVYGKTKDFINEFERLIDVQTNYLLVFLSSMRWLSLRLELMTNLMTLAVALFVTFGISSAPYSFKAMAISLILQVASNFQAAARVASETEAYFTAAEGMLQYMKV